MSAAFTSYTQLVLYKGLWTMANHPSYYEHIQGASLLAGHDPTFTAPIAIMILNYILLQRSDHPFLFNIRQNYGFLFKATLVMASSSVAIVLP